MRTSKASRMIGSDIERDGSVPRQDSLRSSRTGSFLDREPVFDSGGSSDSEDEYTPTKSARQPVSVVWQKITVETGCGVYGFERRTLLKDVSGFAEPRSSLAVVGPNASGKSALVSLIGGTLRRGTKVTGSLAINGKSIKDTWVQPTYLNVHDEPLAGVTVEQALVYTALLQMPDTGNGELEDEDVLLGIQEGCALAIMRAINDLTREGCTAIVSVCQPTTDLCSFFSRAYILVNGEVIYFGDTGEQAMALLATAGMPCPPLYSPVEQYIRLVDSSFEVYLQAPGGTGMGLGDDWNAQFSSMMFKVLQGSYTANAIYLDNQQQANRLAGSVYVPFKDQGLQGLPLYLGRILFAVLIALIYGGTYWKLNNSFRGAQQRTTVLFIVAAIIPATAIGTLPFYHNSVSVFRREYQRCNLMVTTYFWAMCILTTIHLAIGAALASVAFILMADLHKSAAAWGYFILNATLVQMCADSMILAIATALPRVISFQVGFALLVIQGLACGYFPGSNRGFNLPVSAVSFTSWSYRGLLQNEFLYRAPTIFSCPAQNVVEVTEQQFKGCTLDQTGAYLVLSQDIAMKTNSRWDPIYVLLGIYAFWTLLYLVALKFRSLRNTISPNSKIEFNVHRIVNPIHSQEAAQPVINGYNPAFTSPV